MPRKHRLRGVVGVLWLLGGQPNAPSEASKRARWMPRKPKAPNLLDIVYGGRGCILDRIKSPPARPSQFYRKALVHRACGRL